MKDLRYLLTEISELTSAIESDYPELYQFLDENPMTLPTIPHPEVNRKVMEDYLQSLRQLLEHHLQTHQGENE